MDTTQPHIAVLLQDDKTIRTIKQLKRIKTMSNKSEEFCISCIAEQPLLIAHINKSLITKKICDVAVVSQHDVSEYIPSIYFNNNVYIVGRTTYDYTTDCIVVTTYSDSLLKNILRCIKITNGKEIEI